VAGRRSVIQTYRVAVRDAVSDLRQGELVTAMRTANEVGQRLQGAGLVVQVWAVIWLGGATVVVLGAPTGYRSSATVFAARTAGLIPVTADVLAAAVIYVNVPSEFFGASACSRAETAVTLSSIPAALILTAVAVRLWLSGSWWLLAVLSALGQSLSSVGLSGSVPATRATESVALARVTYSARQSRRLQLSSSQLDSGALVRYQASRSRRPRTRRSGGGSQVTQPVTALTRFRSAPERGTSEFGTVMSSSLHRPAAVAVQEIGPASRSPAPARRLPSSRSASSSYRVPLNMAADDRVRSQWAAMRRVKSPTPAPITPISM
jgi:hypothetical protein